MVIIFLHVRPSSINCLCSEASNDVPIFIYIVRSGFSSYDDSYNLISSLLVKFVFPLLKLVLSLEMS